MTISKNNIEAYLLDYFEGNLDPLLTAELMAFLAENPEYEKWLPEYDFYTGPANGPPFEEKSLLKKDFRDIPVITVANFEEFCIASAEGLLREKDIVRLNDYLLQHPEKVRIHSLYARLKLQADKNLLFPDKARLKRPAGRVRYLRPLFYALGAAASVALLLMLVSRKPAVTEYAGTSAGIPGMESTTSAPLVQIRVENPQTNQDKIPNIYPAGRIRASKDTDPVSISDEHVKLAPLTALVPVPANPLSAVQPVPGIRPLIRPATHNAPVANLIANRTSGKEDTPDHSFLTALFNKLNFWNAAGTAISGFNYLTESQVSLTKTTDESGRLTGLALDTQQYIISGSKIK